MFVVAGVTGNTGSVVADALLAQGKPVRVLVRDAARAERYRARGAEVAVAAFDDPAAVARALQGAEGAYLLMPPLGFTRSDNDQSHTATGRALVEAVQKARPRHVVFLSSIGAQLDGGTGPIKYVKPVEQGLAASGVPVTFLRAAFFQENWGSMLRPAIDSGSLYYAIPVDHKFDQVATRDIGLHVARLLLDPIASGTRTVNLAGPEPRSLRDVAEALGRLGGKAIQPVQVPTAGVVAALKSQGASDEVAALYGEMLEGFSKGLIAWESQHGLVRGQVTVDETLRRLLEAPAS